MTLRRCRGCDVYWLGFAVKRYEDNAWTEIPAGAFSQLHDDELELKPLGIEMVGQIRSEPERQRGPLAGARL